MPTPRGYVWLVRFGPVWMGVLITIMAANLLTFASRVSTVADAPLGGALWSTWSWVLILIVGWSIDVHANTMARYRRPRMCVVHGGVRVPVKLKTLGRDVDGYWSWLIVDRAVHSGDVLMTDAIPPRSAVYFLTTSGELARGHRDD